MDCPFAKVEAATGGEDGDLPRPKRLRGAGVACIGDPTGSQRRLGSTAACDKGETCERLRPAPASNRRGTG